MNSLFDIKQQLAGYWKGSVSLFRAHLEGNIEACCRHIASPVKEISELASKRLAIYQNDLRLLNLIEYEVVT